MRIKRTRVDYVNLSVEELESLGGTAGLRKYLESSTVEDYVYQFNIEDAVFAGATPSHEETKIEEVY